MPTTYYYDPSAIYYYIFMLPGLIVVLWASYKVKSTFSRYSGVLNSRGLTGEGAAQAVLSAYNVWGVVFERVSGSLTDHYDPRKNVIRLSDDVFYSSSCAAIGVAAHEAGHAAQYSDGYLPIKVRTAILPICNIGSRLSIPLLIIGSIFTFRPLLVAGVAAFGVALLFQLVTLPVEFNASRRALKVIREQGLLYGEEYEGAKKVLTAAAMPDVAGRLQAPLQLLYYSAMLAGSTRRNRR